MQRVDDVNQEVLDVLLGFLKNGEGLPEARTAKQRWEAQAALFKIMFDKFDGMAIDVKTLAEGVKKLQESPSLSYMLRYQTVKFLGGLAAVTTFMVALWFVLFVLATHSVIGPWLAALLGMPALPG